MNSIEQQPVKTLEEALETLSSTPPGVETLQPVASAGNVETGTTQIHSAETGNSRDNDNEGTPWILREDEKKPKNDEWNGSGYPPTWDEDGNKTSGDGAAEIVVRKRDGEPPL
ncbi:hypothetical protein KBG23_03000 [Candidatus Dojkabacteria bacterium]|jgi:hypothetical protein|nr:hypothetical protein [Candidatus Dojkabacteria bacterium]